MSQDNSKSELTKVLFTLIENQQPPTVDRLAQLAQERTMIPKEEIVKHIITLQSQGRIKLTEQLTKPTNLALYLKSEKAYWYWATVLFASITTLIVFAIPENAYPVVYMRYLLGTIFVVWLPGYTLTRTLFPKRLSTAGDSKQQELDIVERLALSIGLSLALVPLVGLIFNYTPWGIRLAPMVIILFLLAIAFATAAIVREYQQHKQNIV